MTMNEISRFITIVFAVTMFVIGVSGYMQLNDLSSVIIGVGIGVLVMSTLNVYKTEPLSAYLYVAAITLVMSGYFLFKYFNTYEFVFDGIAFILCITTFSIVGLSWLKESKGKS